jgi:NAD-dependent SIR2 family protein deacetylase
MLNLHGTSLTYRCQNPKCKIEYTHHYVTSSDGIPTCEVCGRELKPNLLLVGDNYDDNEFHAMKLKMVDTHTLILIGFDFTEEPLTEILASFCDIKLLNKSTGKPEDVKMLVTVHEPGTHINEEDIGFFEFWVEDDCGEATGRLLKAFEE